METKKVQSKQKFIATGITTAMVASIAAPVAIPAVKAAGNFIDVNSDAFYSKAVNELSSKGIIGGYSDGTFQPNKSVTRAEAAKILAYDLGLNFDQESSKFTDVNGNNWFYQPVTALAQEGGINGYEDGSFKPNKTITRAEMASLIVKAYGLKVDSSVSTPFTDVAPNSWYAEAVQALYANKVTTGKGSVNTFAPNDPVTRGEMAVFVQRASQLKSGITPQLESSSTIEDVTASGIVIGGTTYAVADSIKGLLGVHNAAVLKGAEIEFEETKGTIDKINSLQINAAGASSTAEFANNLVLDGKGDSVGDLVVNANYITVKNATVSNDLTITDKLVNDFYSEKLIVKGNTVVKGGDTNTVVFKDGSLQSIELEKDSVHFDATGSTTIKEIIVYKNAKISSAKSIGKIIVKEKGIKLTFGSNTKVDNIELPDGVELEDVVTSSSDRKKIKNVNGKSNSEYSSTGSGGGGSSSSGGDSSDDDHEDDEDIISFGKVISAAGTYGPATGSITIDGDLEIATENVILQNVNITGDLILGEGISDGEVTLKGVTVQGQTIVNGGGTNSIYFEDSVLLSVIVNKNNGAVRIVAQGNTKVYEVQLETPVIMEERNLVENADGFINVIVPESFQSGLTVELIGIFETINSRATNVRIQLQESTDIHTLILNAAAAVLGNGVIRTAEINANGSTISTYPQNLLLDINGSIKIGGFDYYESYSEATEATLKGIHLNPYSISLNFDNFIAGLDADDFDLTATLDGNLIELEDYEYDSAKNRFYYSPVSLEENIGKTLAITVTPATTTEDTIKVLGEPQTETIEIENGFGGRITDIKGIGVEGATIKFRSGSGVKDGEIVGQTVTDKYGFYSINLKPGIYTGELEKQGFITTYIIATSSSDEFLKDQNETAVRAAASEEIKIMLSWGEYPEDLDSHLTGPTADQEAWFHTFFDNEVYENDGVTYVDLDWDDTESYGPETTTIRRLVDGQYIFFVHNYSATYEDEEYTTGDSITLRNSNAKVQIYKGNSIVADETFTVTTGEDDEYYWVVFRLDISNDGENVSITPINYLADFADWDDYDFIPGEIQQFKDPRAAIQEKIDYVESNIDITNTTLSTEQKDALVKAVAEAKAVLTNENTAVAELVAKLIQLLDAIEPFKDADSVGTLLDRLTIELRQMPDVLNSITLDNYYEYEEYLSNLKALIDTALEEEIISEDELKAIEYYNSIPVLEEMIGKMYTFDGVVGEIEDELGEDNDYNEDEDYYEITSDLSLITETTIEDLPVSISWESSNETIVSTTGEVTRPKIGSGNAPVTLTATITMGDESLTKSFNVIVLEEDFSFESISFIDLPGTEGFLTTGDTIQFAFNYALPREAQELYAETVKVSIMDLSEYESTTADGILIELGDEQILPHIYVEGADYVLNGSVVYKGKVYISDRNFEIRLEELEEIDGTINPEKQPQPTLVLEPVFLE